MKPSQLILCVGVTPCIQRTLRFHHLVPGQVNRAHAVSVAASGKGTNVSRVIRGLGGSPRLVTLLGGASGEDFHGRIQAEGIPADVVFCQGPTRMCQTLIDEHGEQVTELVEESPTVAEADWEALDRLIGRRLKESAAQLLSGRLPPGAPPETYARWVRLAHQEGVPTLVDTQQEPLIAAVAEKPFLVKINADELVMSYPGTGAEPAGLQYGIDRIREAGVEWVLITRGEKPALLVGEQGAWRYRIPALRTVNPIGSGDATLAGTAWGMQLGLAFPDAVQLGLACGCANALTAEPGIIRPEEVETLRSRIERENA